MNKTFKIRATGFQEIKKQLLIKSIPILLLSITFGIAMVFFNVEAKEDLFAALPFIIPIFLFSLGYGLFIGLKRQKLLFESYKLVFLESTVTREQHNTPTINIQFDDIKSIIKNKNGSYTISGKTSIGNILIPSQIEDCENLEMLFSKIKPIEELSQPTFEEKYTTLITVFTLICMAVVYVSFDKILVGTCGLIVTILLIRSFFQIRKNKNIDNKTKRSSYYVLLVIASIIAVTIMKITAF
ncbi:hypothetical protein [Flavobacterium sp. FlaQc-50]|jgi:hypothetical protein|uniref:hypothetical protein n=1 Tax=unclassified Flavobacterium TaxID=196869 RepID=UPI0037579AE1